MSTTLIRRICGIWLCIMLGGLVALAAPHPLSDSQLDGVYAAGLDVQISMDMDLAATNPESVIIQGGDTGAANSLLSTGLTLSRSNLGTRNSGSFDPTGAYMPNLQNLVVNNINITGDALKNATTLMNIFALQGDVAVGMNLNVVVNPSQSYIAPVQTNVNWGTLNLGSALSSLSGL